MKSAVYERFGKPSEVLGSVDRPMPEPGPGEVRIRMTMASMHNHDLITVAGNYGYKPDLPAIAGSEAAGVVHALGDGVTHLAIGQRIAVSGVRGAWAEYFLAPAASIVPLPDSIGDEVASQMISMPLSALILLEFLGVKPGQWVIQNAANGAVAKVLAMIAQTRGIAVVNLVRRDETIAELNALGIENVVSTQMDGWKDRVRALVGEHPITAAVDGVGGKSAGELMSLLGENGTFVSFGQMSGQPLELSAGDLVFKQIVAKGFWLAKIMQTTPRETVGQWMGALIGLIAEGKITLQNGGVFALDDIKAAADASAQPGRAGKILLKP